MTEVLDRIRIAQPDPGRSRSRPNRVKACSSRTIRAHLRRKGITTTIPVKDDQARNRQTRGQRGGRPPTFDTEAYKGPNGVERCFNALKHKRGVPTRYDRVAVHFEATVRVANIDRWLKRFS